MYILYTALNLLLLSYLVYPELKKGRVNMESEEIIVLETSEDEPIGPLGFCCHLLYLPYMR